MKQSFQSMIKNAGSCIFYVVVGIALAFVINHGLAFALSTDMPVVAVESNSMVPTFYKGDILILKGISKEDVKVGDIVVFSPYKGATPVVHRIIKINKDGTFQTKGDANSGQLPFEKRIKFEQIHGKVIFIIPYLGWIKLGFTEYIMPNFVWVFLALVITGFIYFAGKRCERFIKIK